jgi:hypothetical protein
MARPKRRHISLDTFAKVWENLERVKSLLDLYAAQRGKGRGRRVVALSDLLRAAVVLLHASLEDFLRQVATERLPSAGAAALDQVPLAGMKTGRPEKFFLGALAVYRGSMVDDVIRRSVDEHLARASYGSVEEVAVLLQALGVDVKKVNAQFGALAELMKRRHHIVHQADRNPRRGAGQQQAQSLGSVAVARWLRAVEGFVADVDGELPGRAG